MHGFRYDVDKLIEKFGSNSDVERHCDVKASLDFDSDDNIQDPDYKISETETSTDTDIEEMGRQIEENLSNSLLTHFDENSNDQTKKVQNSYSRKLSKEKRNKGASYTNTKNTVVSGRKFVPLNSDCRNKCRHKIPEMTQMEYFNSYWGLGTYNQRILFISGLIEIAEKKTETLAKNIEKPRNRKNHILYHLQYEGQKIKVCQKCFKQCFDETESFLKSVVKKKLEQPHKEFVDKRGALLGTNQLPQIVVDNIKKHINSFPSYESHYSRKHTSLKYFHADLTIAEMYRLYCEEFSSEAASLSKYTEIFKSKTIIIFCEITYLTS